MATSGSFNFSQENIMSKLRNVLLPVALLVSALALSACATKPKEAAAEPATVPTEKVAVPEPVPAPAAAVEQPAPAPVVAAEQPAPKPVVKKTRKRVHKAKAAPVKAPEPEPVAAPAPVVQPEAPVVAQPEPTPPPMIVQPIPKQETPGFLEKYWLWLLGVIIAVIAFWMVKKKD